jgi:hypothetical protein
MRNTSLSRNNESATGALKLGMAFSLEKGFGAACLPHPIVHI